jgi:hypothetical protein
MKFEGIEIALEGIWYEDNCWKSARGRGEKKEKRGEASVRLMSQYGVKPGGGERLLQILEQFGKMAQLRMN